MSTTYRAFFGHAERDFRMTPKLIVELERLTEVGIGSLCKRLFAGDFSHKDICETIRLGLIGGGADPQEAANLVAVYATDAPLARVYPLAVSILEATWFGTDDREQTEGEGANV
jgi:hypothetical protein